MKLLDANDPFFAPVWRRWATVLVPAVMAGFELRAASPGWAVLFGATAAWAFYELIVKGPDSKDPNSKDPDQP